jgi:hypothetical protein
MWNQNLTLQYLRQRRRGRQSQLTNMRKDQGVVVVVVVEEASVGVDAGRNE